MDKTEQILQAAKEGAKKYFDEQVSLLTKFSSIDCGTCDEEGNKKIVAIVENLLNTIQGIQIEKHYSKGFGQHIVAKLNRKILMARLFSVRIWILYLKKAIQLRIHRILKETDFTV